jgi:glycine cleavage system regulatory protein
MKWFRANLPFPERVARSRRPKRHHAAVSWFKQSATDHIHMARELAALLDAHDIRTEMLTTDRPGYVVYEDEYQVLAEPFRREFPGSG